MVSFSDILPKECIDSGKIVAQTMHTNSVQDMNGYGNAFTGSNPHNFDALRTLGEYFTTTASQLFEEMNVADTYLKRCWGEGVVNGLEKPNQIVRDALATQNLTPEKVPEFPAWAVYGVKHGEAVINEITKYLGHGTSDAVSYLSSGLGKIFSLIPAEAAGILGLAVGIGYGAPKIARKICGDKETYEKLFPQK